MIKEEYVYILMNGRNIKYYSNLGYDPKYNEYWDSRRRSHENAGEVSSKLRKYKNELDNY